MNSYSLETIFLKLDAAKWEHVNRNTIYKRKVMVPIGHRNFTAMFNAYEISEFKSLFNNISKRNNEFELIKFRKIEAQLSVN